MRNAEETAREVVDAIYAEWDASGTCGPPIMRKHIAAALHASRDNCPSTCEALTVALEFWQANYHLFTKGGTLDDADSEEGKTYRWCRATLKSTEPEPADVNRLKRL